MSIDRNRRVWEEASFGEEIDEFDFRCIAFGVTARYVSGNFQQTVGVYLQEDKWLLTTAPGGYKIGRG